MMSEFIQNQFGHFEWNDINPVSKLNDALCRFGAWAVPAFIFVLWADKYYPHSEFYQAAIDDGIGPSLWNAIGPFGLFVWGFVIVFPQIALFKKVSRKLLLVTYDVGSLTFGLLLGQWWLLLANYEWVWHKSIFVVISVFMLVVVFLYNFSIWYLSFLVAHDSKEASVFVIKLKQVNKYLRLAIGMFVSLLITVIFLNA